MTTGIPHGPLSSDDYTKLTGLSALEYAGGIVTARVDGTLRMDGWQAFFAEDGTPASTMVSLLSYLGEWSDNTRTVILAPEGGWKSNPVPGRLVNVTFHDGDKTIIPHMSDIWDWSMVSAFSLIEDAKPSDYEQCAADQGVGQSDAERMRAAVREAITTLAMLKRNVTTEILKHDGLFRWEGVPEVIQARIDDLTAALAEKEAGQ